MHGYTATSVTISLRDWGASSVPYNYVERAPKPMQLELVRVREVSSGGFPSYTEARWAPPARRSPRPHAVEPEQLERADARRTDREPGRRRARSRDYARTGRCSRRPAP